MSDDYVPIFGRRFFHVLHISTDDEGDEIMERVPERHTTLEAARQRCRELNGQPREPDLQTRVAKIRDQAPVVPEQRSLDYQERAAGGDD